MHNNIYINFLSKYSSSITIHISILLILLRRLSNLLRLLLKGLINEWAISVISVIINIASTSSTKLIAINILILFNIIIVVVIDKIIVITIIMLKIVIPKYLNRFLFSMWRWFSLLLLL